MPGGLRVALRSASGIHHPRSLSAQGTGRAFRWKRLLDEGSYASVSDFARAEKPDRTYVGDVLRLKLLAPDIVETIMDWRQPTELGVHVLREGFLAEWGEQRWKWLPGRPRASSIP